MRPRTDLIATTDDGLRFYCSFENEIERQLLDGTFEPEASALARRFVAPGDVVVDIGANIGYYTLLFAKLVGSKGVVHAFEPTSYAYARLGQNLTLNSDLFSNIELNQCGLLAAETEREEAIESQFSQRRPAYSRRENIRFTTLTRYCETRRVDSIDFVKVDVDGYDEEVILGGREILKKYHPIILCEFCDRVLRNHGTSLRSYVELYEALGYDRFITVPDEPPKALWKLIGEPDIENRTVNALLTPARNTRTE